MAFVKLVNGDGTVRTVPSSVVDRFKALGYNEYNAVETEKFDEIPEYNETPEPPTLLKEDKPLTEWTQEEFKEYAAEHGIDLKGLKKKEAIEAIKAHMEE